MTDVSVAFPSKAGLSRLLCKVFCAGGVDYPSSPVLACNTRPTRRIILVHRVIHRVQVTIPARRCLGMNALFAVKRGQLSSAAADRRSLPWSAPFRAATVGCAGDLPSGCLLEDDRRLPLKIAVGVYCEAGGGAMVAGLQGCKKNCVKVLLNSAEVPIGEFGGDQERAH